MKDSILKALLVTFTSLLFYSTLSHAQSCFLLAQTYYEQLYCEVKSEGRGLSLPTFIDFKKNNELTQALLLKRDAESLRLDFKMPKGNENQSKSKASQMLSMKPSAIKVNRDKSNTCALKNKRIECGNQQFLLIGNRKNKELFKNALSDANRLELAVYRKSKTDAKAYGRYLTLSYIKYLERMQSIGLGGATMPYGRFHFLFSDLEEKGVDARARFAQMFEYLKQDKSRNAVNTDIDQPSSLSLNDCMQANDTLFICAHQRRNYLFVRSDV